MSELDRWIHRLQEELGVDQDLDVDMNGLLDLARVAAHEVDRPAAPLTTVLVGYAAGRSSAGGIPTSVEALSARAAALATSWRSTS